MSARTRLAPLCIKCFPRSQATWAVVTSAKQHESTESDSSQWRNQECPRAACAGGRCRANEGFWAARSR